VLPTGHTIQPGTSWSGLVGRPGRPGISTFQIRKEGTLGTTSPAPLTDGNHPLFLLRSRRNHPTWCADDSGQITSTGSLQRQGTSAIEAGVMCT
jgi:hypothetical protein